jgi:hypothetical protein
LREQIRTSTRARSLRGGLAEHKPQTYSKWRGSHWVLQSLADIGYPSGDPDLEPTCQAMVRTWLNGRYYNEFDGYSVPRGDPRVHGVPMFEGRARRCASQQGSALLATLRLGWCGDEADDLVERLLHWQWPDGGWNCDTDPAASSSSVHETLFPMRGLAAYGHERSDAEATEGARRAAEVFLSRRLLWRRSTGRLIRKEWTRLHYPPYWHYDVLAGLKGLAEMGLATDDRCADALDLLESKQLPSGGWAAEAPYYRPDGNSSRDHVDWGPTNASALNEWVTVDALTVLRAAGRP